ncbi:MAG: helix-turn-helix transcriptional regulator [Bacillota bacterium]|nr:helix-turn-helix transcriptional regulator [Bacillota bacterium]MDW7678258.1 helix-turn-helix transcriptional regulator [Bacillota bacterium]
MAIIINIDVMLAKRKMSVTELSERVGITMANISILKNGKAKAIRFSTLEAICQVLECQPGDILEYRSEREKKAAMESQHAVRQPIERKKD